MDCHKILLHLTKFNEDCKTDITDEHLKQILHATYLFIPEDILKEIVKDQSIINDKDDISWQYLHLLLYIIKTLCNTEFSEENPLFTVNEFRIFKIAVEIIADIGIIPCLLTQIKIYVNKTRLRSFKLKLENDGILEKYKKLSYTINILFECFDKAVFRPALLSQLDCLLAALLQLSHAPLIKPRTETESNNASNSDFNMTIEIYQQLKSDQENFCKKLHDLMENCPQPILIKELMMILGVQNNPKWLQMRIKHYLISRIILPNGIVALTTAICDEVSDLGKCWDKLDVTARLVVTSHGDNPENYYNSVCSQILELLLSKNGQQGIIIANCCIKALYDYKPEICSKKIIQVIMEPFLVKCNSIEKQLNLIRTEDEVSSCIENLCKLFITTDAEFKCLPIKLLTRVTIPLFYLYIKSYKSIYVLRRQVRQLLLKILTEDSTRETIFSVLLNHLNIESNEFGEKLNFRFGINGGFEISTDPALVDYEEMADCLFDLVKDNFLSFNLFIYLLKILPELNDISQTVETEKLLETPTDTMERIEKQVTAVKLLTLLSSLTLVQEAQIKNPGPLLDFIKSFFFKVISNFGSDDASAFEQNSDILYTCLMLVKIIITDSNAVPTWKTFEDFVASIKQEYDFKKLPSHINSIVEEIEVIVKKKGKLYVKKYYDLSADNKNLSEFDKALTDLADPLLPVRAHGIVTLTKLIEAHHPEAKNKKDFLLCVFQENLNHDDSFIYLAAINGICAMSNVFPEKVIEILVQEFIGMTQQTRNQDISPETRAKLGEILVKTTRELGEMTPKYKSLLVNGFLCGTKDPDPLVRASSLSCLGEFCKIMGFRLGNLIIEILYCIGCIIKTDKDDSCRRAGVLVATLLLRGLGKDALNELGGNLVTLYRGLKHLRDNDKDPVLKLHAQLALEEFDDIVQKFLFAKPKLEKSIFLLPS